VKPMMKCGHAANAEDENGNPVCVICAGITPDAYVVAEMPDLSGRRAKCVYCERKVQSSTDLPFFEYRPNEEFDIYYCGCYGWD